MEILKLWRDITNCFIFLDISNVIKRGTLPAFKHTATSYGLKYPGFEYRWWWDCFVVSRPASRATQRPAQRVPGVRISGSKAGYNMFRGSVKSTGYPLHSPVSPSLPLPCVKVCHHISTGLYIFFCIFVVGFTGLWQVMASSNIWEENCCAKLQG